MIGRQEGNYNDKKYENRYMLSERNKKNCKTNVK